MAPGSCRVVNTDYKSALTEVEHEMLVNKLISVFEADSSLLTEGASRAQLHS